MIKMQHSEMCVKQNKSAKTRREDGKTDRVQINKQKSNIGDAKIVVVFEKQDRS